ncbi:putative oligopeptidase B transcription factor WD40-like family [Rosa chinensis]|uniref:Prolyl endopeptidase n=1 Tax=Rosa chinensis TaxID=74649 RepID=A0A2P6S8G2_ROSCH|nr:protease 2 [Rosa chinensis]XP_040367632.1 protease 2 [Rosa chinensis]XP_040367636.1 protease 2 [Rosa chinensis]PRQ54936.1 putative oligopeptidase B transcription factor WD40-like family [Rosa chinensis]
MLHQVKPLRPHLRHLRLAHFKALKPPESPPKPPNPPQKPETFTLHDHTWQDPYSWMSKLNDKVAMRHMDMYMEQEDKYTEAVMYGTDRLQSKLQSEMASRLSFDLSTPPLKFGPWLYYRRVEEGKQFPVLCRRLASLHDEFISHKSPSAGFDFTSGKRIEQKLIDYNQEAQRFGGYAYEELSEVSPDHRFIAYTMYDKDKDLFRLSVRNLNSGALCSKPQAERVSNLAWAKDGQALLYVVTDQNKRPYRMYCSMIGSTDEDVLVFEESDNNVFVNIRHTKDFRFVTVNTFSTASSKVFLINAADPLSGLNLVWQCEGIAHCVLEHHQGYLFLFTDAAKGGQSVDNHYLLRSPVDSSSSPRIWEDVFVSDPDWVFEDVDFSHTHLVLNIREGRNFRLCSVALPLPAGKGPVHLKELHPQFLPLPKYVSQISPGPNYDYHSSKMRFTISSPVMPDAVVDYDLSNGNWKIIQQQNILHERTKVLYGTASSASISEKTLNTDNLNSANEVSSDDQQLWNDLSEFYACEQHNVSSYDGVLVPLTVVYSCKNKKEDQNPGLLHVHGAYGELLDKRWRSELKSLLDRGWMVAYADVRGGGGGGKKWHHDGRCTKKINSIKDFIACANFLVDKEIVHGKKLAASGYSAGGLVVASAINQCPHLFTAAVLKVPFLDATSTLLYPIIPLTAVDYEEFGYPGDINDFHAIRDYSPYDNIQKDVLYPAVLISSSFNTRFGVWEAAKWVARVRELTVYDPKRPILLNLTTDIVEENRYLQCKESALETAFLIKAMES